VKARKIKVVRGTFFLLLTYVSNDDHGVNLCFLLIYRKKRYILFNCILFGIKKFRLQ